MVTTIQSVFPELSYAETTTSHGLQVTFVMQNSDNHEHIRLVLKELGVPFAKQENNKEI